MGVAFWYYNFKTASTCSPSLSTNSGDLAEVITENLHPSMKVSLLEKQNLYITGTIRGRFQECVQKDNELVETVLDNNICRIVARTTWLPVSRKYKRKNATKRIKEPKKAQQRKTSSIRCNLQQNNPELFTEIIFKNLELKNNDKINAIVDTTKIIKSQEQSKNL